MTRASTIRRAGAVVLVANVLLAVAKGVVWYETGSLAVGSEAINSLIDGVYSAVVLAGLYLTTRPPDFDHPHGHERIEPFVSLAIALGIIGTGVLVLWQSGTAIHAGTITTTDSSAAIVVLVGAGAVKFGLYRYCVAVSHTTDSPALEAAALDNRNDILTVGAALVGVVGARLGAPVLDPLAAGVVAIGILYTGVEIARDNVGYLIGRAPEEDLTARIVRRALAHPDVEGVHDVIAHYVGPEIDVSLHIEVEGDRTLREAHHIESAVVASIRALSAIDDVFVHIDPKELGEWKADERTDRLVEADMLTEDGDSDDSPVRENGTTK